MLHSPYIEADSPHQPNEVLAGCCVGLLCPHWPGQEGKLIWKEQRIKTNFQPGNKPGKPGKEKMPGVCLTMDEVTSLCIGNTTAGIKLGTAVQTCTGREHSFLDPSTGISIYICQLFKKQG